MVERQAYTRHSDPDIIRPYQLYSRSSEIASDAPDANKRNTGIFSKMFKQLFTGHHSQSAKILQPVVLGALFGIAHGALLLSNRYGLRKFQNVRRILDKGSADRHLLLSRTLQGMFLGFGWYIWSSIAYTGPSANTVGRHMNAHGIYGALVTAYLFNPSTAIYGYVIGGGLSLFTYVLNHRSSYPGFYLRLRKTTDEQFDKEAMEFNLQNFAVRTAFRRDGFYVFDEPAAKPKPVQQSTTEE